MVRMTKTLAGILATETVLTRRNHGTATNGNDAAICKLCEKAEETNLHMLCDCTGNTELVMERKIWIQRMRKIVSTQTDEPSTIRGHAGSMECG